MKGHLGAVLTTGLAALALALALLQAAVVAHGAPKMEGITAARSGPTNRYSAPGGRSGIPLVPAEKAQPQKPAPLPENPESSTPPNRHQEEHRSPPSSRIRGSKPLLGPQPARMAAE